MASQKLTVKQIAFCNEYIKSGGNQSEAYRQAYNTENMKPETITRNAHELLKNNNITTRIAELKEKAQKRNDVKLDWVIGRLKEIASKNDSDRVSALDKLMKHLGGYELDNTQHAINITVTPPKFDE